jgi:prepilin signal peptidase PulO-like enzyme (type II secretory pathway)
LDVLGTTLFTAGMIGLAFLLLHLLSGGRAMGLGDAPVALSLSLLCAPYAFSGVLFSFWIGAIIGIAILVMRRGGPRMGIEVPFVPFLAAGYLLAYFIQWNPLADMPW